MRRNCAGADNGCQCIGCRVFRVVLDAPAEIDPEEILNALAVAAATLIASAPPELHSTLVANTVDSINSMVAMEKLERYRTGDGMPPVVTRRIM